LVERRRWKWRHKLRRLARAADIASAPGRSRFAMAEKEAGVAIIFDDPPLANQRAIELRIKAEVRPDRQRQ